jgi:hypothetical protein
MAPLSMATGFQNVCHNPFKVNFHRAQLRNPGLRSCWAFFRFERGQSYKLERGSVCIERLGLRCLVWIEKFFEQLLGSHQRLYRPFQMTGGLIAFELGSMHCFSA